MSKADTARKGSGSLVPVITAGTDPIEPPACKTKRCRRLLPQGWKLPYCRRCHAKNVRDGRLRKANREFPGVDIDAIHYKLGAVRQKKAA